MERIFVQIASYRDPQLLATIKHCLLTASHPERLRFGICWQHSADDAWDNLDEYKADPRFKIMDVPWHQSKGACWARNASQSLYDGEEYTLCVDSHTRFAVGWDELCVGWVKQLQAMGHPKPLITTYLPSFQPEEHSGVLEDDHKLSPMTFKMKFAAFTNESGGMQLGSEYLTNWRDLTAPVPGVFYAGGFSFSIGAFVLEVPHDPNIYFSGEEITIALRAYTWGYDAFAPNRPVAWHEYCRPKQAKHWTDHTAGNKKDLADNLAWFERNTISERRCRVLLGMETDPSLDFGKYGLGPYRTLTQFEQASQLSFKHRRDYTKELITLPTPAPAMGVVLSARPTSTPRPTVTVVPRPTKVYSTARHQVVNLRPERAKVLVQPEKFKQAVRKVFINGD